LVDLFEGLLVGWDKVVLKSSRSLEPIQMAGVDPKQTLDEIIPVRENGN